MGCLWYCFKHITCSNNIDSDNSYSLSYRYLWKMNIANGNPGLLNTWLMKIGAIPHFRLGFLVKMVFFPPPSIFINPGFMKIRGWHEIDDVPIQNGDVPSSKLLVYWRVYTPRTRTISARIRMAPRPSVYLASGMPNTGGSVIDSVNC